MRIYEGERAHVTVRKKDGKRENFIAVAVCEPSVKVLDFTLDNGKHRRVDLRKVAMVNFWSAR